MSFIAVAMQNNALEPVAPEASESGELAKTLVRKNCIIFVFFCYYLIVGNFQWYQFCFNEPLAFRRYFFHFSTHVPPCCHAPPQPLPFLDCFLSNLQVNPHCFIQWRIDTWCCVVMHTVQLLLSRGRFSTSQTLFSILYRWWFNGSWERSLWNWMGVERF